MRRLALMSFAFALTGCLLSDHGVEWQEAKYEVHWIDSYDMRTLSRRIEGGGTIGRVKPEVVAIGSSATHIVAIAKSAYTNELSYYVVDKQKDNDYLNLNEITQGPMTNAEFQALKVEKRLPDFTVRFGAKQIRG